MPNFISEDDIEQALLQRLQHLCGYNVLNCFTAQPDDLNDGSGRSDKRQVILAERLHAAVQRLIPTCRLPCSSKRSPRCCCRAWR